MTSLDPRNHTDYAKHVAPFVKNGVVVDTCVLFELIKGLVDKNISKKTSLELEKIEAVLARYKLWKHLFVTPHILAETCRHIRDMYDIKGANFSKVAEEVVPILQNLGERVVSKSDILAQIDMKNPVIEIGDLSIFVTTDDFMKENKKAAVLSFDRGVADRYRSDPDVMLIDYRAAYLAMI